jgi:hypothetical protein
LADEVAKQGLGGGSSAFVIALILEGAVAGFVLSYAWTVVYMREVLEMAEAGG